MKYIVHDANGKILRSGRCQRSLLAAQARHGETAIEDTDGDTDDRKHRIEGGKRVEFTPPPPPPPSVEVLRARSYPSIPDQLDAIWKGGEEMEIMRAKVMDVKARYPK